MLKIGINGFGRIGRTVFRAAAYRNDLQVVAVNDLLDPEHLAYMLKYDSVHGPMQTAVAGGNGFIDYDGNKVTVFSEKDLGNLAWGSVGVDVVIESTGIFLTKEVCEHHLRAGAGMVILSAPAKDDMPVYVYGVNSEGYGGEQVVSGASCTTNCLAPLAKIVNDAFGIRRGLMTTVHAATATQKVVDGPSTKEWRFGRSILENIIPASTGAAKALGKVIPELDGKLTGMAFRVPVSDVSVVDLTCELEKNVPFAELCRTVKLASQGSLQGILKYTEEPLVSTDVRGESCTSVFDAKASMALDSTFVKLVAWYDNEWGYACKLLDLASAFSKK